MIDNYDSFTFNLVQYLGELGAEVKVLRNDEIDVAGIVQLAPSHLVLSPGPCTPTEAGVCVPAVQALLGRLPILGVCLGHQSIGQALGGRIVRAKRQMHGKASTVTTDQKGLFKGLSPEFSVIRYHSLVIEPASCPPELEVTARSEDGEIVLGHGQPKECKLGRHAYLLFSGLPQFFFHVNMDYALLRHNGMEIGKKDYMGAY